MSFLSIFSVFPILQSVADVARCKANVEIVNKVGYTSLMVAATSGHVDVAGKFRDVLCHAMPCHIPHIPCHNLVASPMPPTPNSGTTI